MSATIFRSAARKACSAAFIRPVCSVSSLSRGFSSESGPEMKVAILGAAGGIGQPLSLLMRLNPSVSKSSLYDIAGTPGVAADVSHINTRSQVTGYAGEERLGEALEGSDNVIIPAGVPRKPGMTRDDVYNINASIVNSLCIAIAKYCPNALVNMISNPVNSTVPIAAEILKKAGTYDEKRLFGGHAGITILPLFSQATPSANLADEDIKALTKRMQGGGTEVVEAKAGKGSATLSISYPGAILAGTCLNGLNGVPDVVECSYMQSTITGVPFFAALNLALFWHINEGIKEIMADYVHHEITRNLILVSLRLFLLIVTKDILLSVVS